MRRVRGVEFVSCATFEVNCCIERIFGKAHPICPACAAVVDFGGSDVPMGMHPCIGCGNPTGGRARYSPIGLHANFPMQPCCEHCLGDFVIVRKLNAGADEEPFTGELLLRELK